MNNEINQSVPLVLPLVVNMKIGDEGYITCSELQIYQDTYYINMDSCYYSLKNDVYAFLVRRESEKYWFVDFTYSKNSGLSQSATLGFLKRHEYIGPMKFAHMPLLFISDNNLHLKYAEHTQKYLLGYKDKNDEMIKEALDTMNEYISEYFSSLDSIEKKYYCWSYWDEKAEKIADKIKKHLLADLASYVKETKFKHSVSLMRQFEEDDEAELWSIFAETLTTAQLKEFCKEFYHNQEILDGFRKNIEEFHSGYIDKDDVDGDYDFYIKFSAWYREVLLPVAESCFKPEKTIPVAAKNTKDLQQLFASDPDSMTNEELQSLEEIFVAKTKFEEAAKVRDMIEKRKDAKVTVT